MSRNFRDFSVGYNGFSNTLVFGSNNFSEPDHGKNRIVCQSLYTIKHEGNYGRANNRDFHEWIIVIKFWQYFDFSLKSVIEV